MHNFHRKDGTVSKQNHETMFFIVPETWRSLVTAEPVIAVYSYRGRYLSEQKYSIDKYQMVT